MRALIEKDLTRLLKGKKTYLILILIPILLVFFVGQTLNVANPKDLPVAIVGNNEELVELIGGIGFFDVQQMSHEEGDRNLMDEEVCAIVILPDTSGKVTIVLDRTQLITSSLADLVVDSINYDLRYLNKPYHIYREYRGDDVTIFAFIMAGLMVIVAVFIGIFGGSTEITTERRVLFRILFFRRSLSIYLEKIIFILFISIIEILIILLIGMYLYDFPLTRPLILLGGIVLTAVGSTALGILIALFVKERSAYISVVLSLFLIFFSGVLYPIILMPQFLREAAAFTPTYYAAKVVRMCTIKEVPSEIVYQNVEMLALFSIIILVISSAVFIARAKAFSE
jgi:ABC-2 type transport system permease protein